MAKTKADCGYFVCPITDLPTDNEFVGLSHDYTHITTPFSLTEAKEAAEKIALKRKVSVAILSVEAIVHYVDTPTITEYIGD